MPVESVHPSEVLLTPFARIRPNIKMKLLMPLAVVLSGESLATPRPFALIGFYFGMRTQMTLQIEVSCERTATPWYGTLEVRGLLPPLLASICGAWCRHIHFRHRQYLSGVAYVDTHPVIHYIAAHYTHVDTH